MRINDIRKAPALPPKSPHWVAWNAI